MSHLIIIPQGVWRMRVEIRDSQNELLATAVQNPFSTRSEFTIHAGKPDDPLLGRLRGKVVYDAEHRAVGGIRRHWLGGYKIFAADHTLAAELRPIDNPFGIFADALLGGVLGPIWEGKHTYVLTTGGHRQPLARFASRARQRREVDFLGELPLPPEMLPALCVVLCRDRA